MTQYRDFGDDAGTSGPARASLERLACRDTPIPIAGLGYICRCWGDAPNFQAWRGSKDQLILVGTYNDVEAATAALRVGLRSPEEHR